MKQTALVGFSANAEIVQVYNRMNSQKKGKLESIKPFLCGTSVNVARAISMLGQTSKVLALTGVNDFESYILRFVLKQFSIPYSEFKILNHSHISVLPIDGIPEPKTFGLKGDIQSLKLKKVLKKIKNEEGKWRICTGVRLPEFPLVEGLFNKSLGYRSLNPRQELVEDQRNLFAILANTDFLIMNRAEYDACKIASIQDLHLYGPKLVVVTQREMGGIFSLYGHRPERFQACTDYINTNSEICNPGSGDWFNAAFHVRCMELDKSIYQLSLKDVRNCVSFAARVAGKKVTMPGAANGPTKQDLII